MKALVLLSLLVPAFACAEETATKPAETKAAKPDIISRLTCHGPHEERFLDIMPNGAGCVLMYTRQKEAKEVARAQYSLEPCQKAMKKIRDRLEAGSFACE